jgi:histone deacetylase complex regulatory component SIN3
MGRERLLNPESDEDRHVKKISKENVIPADGVVVAPPTITFATPDETALIWREDPVEFDHALAYISFVKSHFASSPEVYQQFISIVYSTKDQEDQDCLSAIVDEVTLLFDNQATLLEGFVYFLPNSYRVGQRPRLK